jgi:hypothetical protein
MPTCLLHTLRPHRRRPFVLVLHLHQHQSSRNLHLQYLAKSQSTQRCQSLITPGSDHLPILEPHMVLTGMGPPLGEGAEVARVLQTVASPRQGGIKEARGRHPCKTPDFHRKPEYLYHSDSLWISGYHVQNVSQINKQSHTSHHIRVKVHN